MKLPVEAAFSLGTRVAISSDTETRGTKYCRLATGGAIVANHLLPIGETLSDPVSVAERLLETPYLWGGRSGHGLDCSGLVQLTHAMCGISVSRDTLTQQDSIGEEIHPDRDGVSLRRGDLVFWKGHVAMMIDGKTIIHASGHAMSVVKEDFSAAISRTKLELDTLGRDDVLRFNTGDWVEITNDAREFAQLPGEMRKITVHAFPPARSAACDSRSRISWRSG